MTADPRTIQWHKRLIPSRRDAGDQVLHEVQLVHDLSEVVAGLGGLAEGEAAWGRDHWAFAHH